MMLFISVVDYHVWRRFALPAYLISLVLVVLVKTPLGYEANGARRWIKIAGVSLQPAEVVKITLILLLASVICIMGKQVRTWRGIIIVMGAALIPAVMILSLRKHELRHYHCRYCSCHAFCGGSALHEIYCDSRVCRMSCCTGGSGDL